MQIPPFKASATFAYAGQVTGLDPSIAWGAASQISPQQALCPPQSGWPPLHVTFAPANDYDTSHKYNIALEATSEETAAWGMNEAVIFDIMFFDVDNPDPVLLTRTLRIPILQPVTHRP